MSVTWQQIVMYGIGGLLIYLAIAKEFEPALLMPMGFGAILVNLPLTGVLDQVLQGGIEAQGIIQWLFQTTIEASEALPILLFIGIGAMIDFGPLLSNPKMMVFGAAAQFGIFFTISLAALFGFDLKDAACIGIIGAADGPLRLWFRRFSNPNIWVLSQLRPIPIWRWCQSSSQWQSSWSLPGKNAASGCTTIQKTSPKPPASFSQSL